MIKNFVKFLIVLGAVSLVMAVLAVAGVINPFNCPPFSWLCHLNLEQRLSQKISNDSWYWINGSSNIVTGPTINNFTPERVIEKTMIIRETAPVAPPPAPAPAPQTQPAPEQTSVAEPAEQIEFCEEVTTVVTQPRGALINVNADIGYVGGGSYYYPPPVVIVDNHRQWLPHNVDQWHDHSRTVNTPWCQGGNGNRGTTVPCGNQGGGGGRRGR